MKYERALGETLEDAVFIHLGPRPGPREKVVAAEPTLSSCPRTGGARLYDGDLREASAAAERWRARTWSMPRLTQAAASAWISGPFPLCPSAVRPPGRCRARTPSASRVRSAGESVTWQVKAVSAPPASLTSRQQRSSRLDLSSSTPERGGPANRRSVVASDDQTIPRA